MGLWQQLASAKRAAGWGARQTGWLPRLAVNEAWRGVKRVVRAVKKELRAVETWRLAGKRARRGVRKELRAVKDWRRGVKEALRAVKTWRRAVISDQRMQCCNPRRTGRERRPVAWRERQWEAWREIWRECEPAPWKESGTQGDRHGAVTGDCPLQLPTTAQGPPPGLARP